MLVLTQAWVREFLKRLLLKREAEYQRTVHWTKVCVVMGPKQSWCSWFTTRLALSVRLRGCLWTLLKLPTWKRSCRMMQILLHPTLFVPTAWAVKPPRTMTFRFVMVTMVNLLVTIKSVVNPPSLTFPTTHGSIQSAQYRGQMLILASRTQIMHPQCMLHLPVPLPRPLPLQAQALTLTVIPQVLILLLMVVVQDVMFLFHQMIHLILKCSANRRPRWGAASLFFFVPWDVAGIDRTQVPPTTVGGGRGSARNQFSSLNRPFLGCAGYFLGLPTFGP